MSKIFLGIFLAHLASSAPINADQISQPEQRYLDLYLRLNDAAGLEKKGELSAAYCAYKDSQKRLLAMRSDYVGQAGEFSRTMEIISTKLEELKKEISNSSPSHPTSPHIEDVQVAPSRK